MISSWARCDFTWPTSDNSSLLDVASYAQDLFNLCWTDSEAGTLDLIVTAFDEIEVSVEIRFYQVAGITNRGYVVSSRGWIRVRPKNLCG